MISGLVSSIGQQKVQRLLCSNGTPKMLKPLIKRFNIFHIILIKLGFNVLWQKALYETLFLLKLTSIFWKLLNVPDSN